MHIVFHRGKKSFLIIEMKLRYCITLHKNTEKTILLYIIVLLVVEHTLASISSVVEWLKRRARDQHDLGSKPTHAILLCPWKRHFTAHSPAWWSWQSVLNYSHISIKL